MSEGDTSASIPYDTQVGLALSIAYMKLAGELHRQGLLDVAPLIKELEVVAADLRKRVPETAKHLDQLASMIHPAGGVKR